MQAAPAKSVDDDVGGHMQDDAENLPHQSSDWSIGLPPVPGTNQRLTIGV
jgi:hypothetical protein